MNRCTCCGKEIPVCIPDALSRLRKITELHKAIVYPDARDKEAIKVVLHLIDCISDAPDYYETEGHD